MSNDVFANGREISCKEADGKSICAFPDVCFTPPQTPATPPGVPIPYPNTAFAKDTTKGSKTVKISGEEVMLKNKSYFKKSTGDEAGCAPKKGIVTSKITGKVYFTSWSPNVKFEGKNVVRHLDLTTHNHGSFPGNTSTWPYIDQVEGSPGKGCEKEREQVEKCCKGTPTQNCENLECQQAKKCMLVPYAPTERQIGCCPGLTPHHLVEVHCFKKPGKRNSIKVEDFVNKDFKEYRPEKAPCVCVKGTRYTDEHGDLHALQNTAELECMELDGPRSQMGGKNGAWNYCKARNSAINAHRTVFKSKPDGQPCCSEACLKAQLDNYHNQMGVKNDTPLRADRSPLKEEQKEWAAETLKSNVQKT